MSQMKSDAEMLHSVPGSHKTSVSCQCTRCVAYPVTCIKGKTIWTLVRVQDYCYWTKTVSISFFLFVENIFSCVLLWEICIYSSALLFVLLPIKVLLTCTKFPRLVLVNWDHLYCLQLHLVFFLKSSNILLSLSTLISLQFIKNFKERDVCLNHFLIWV